MKRFLCPHCMQEIQVEDNMAGQAMTCPHCSKQFAIPVANAMPMALVNDFSASAPHPKTLSLATTSMILGIISFMGVPFCGIAALITGIKAQNKINSSNGLLLGNGQATTGIVFGCWSIIRITILAILAAILLPELSKARERAIEISCINNLKQIAIASQLYADDNNGYLPNSMEDTQSYLESIFGSTSVLKCPNAPNSKDGTYTFFPLEERKLYKIKKPSETPVAICTRHKQGDIVLYADGHVQTNPKQTIKHKPNFPFH